MSIKSIVGILILFATFHPFSLQAECLYDDCENSFFEGYEDDLEGVDINSLMVFKEDLENCEVTEYGCEVTLRDSGLAALYGLFLRSLNPTLSIMGEPRGVTQGDLDQIRREAAAESSDTGKKVATSSADDVAGAVKAAESTPPASASAVVDDTVKAVESTAPPARPRPPAIASAGDINPNPARPSINSWQDALHNRGSVSVRETFRTIVRDPVKYKINAEFLNNRRLRIRGADKDLIIKFHRLGGGNSLSVLVCPDSKSCELAGRYTRAMLSNTTGMNGLVGSIAGNLPENFVLDRTVNRGFWRKWVFSKRGFIALAALAGSYGAYYVVDRYDEEGVVVNFTLEAIEKMRSLLNDVYESLSNEPINNMLDGGGSIDGSADGSTGATRLEDL